MNKKIELEIRNIGISFEVMEEEIKKWKDLHEQEECGLNIEKIKEMYNELDNFYTKYVSEVLGRLKPRKPIDKRTIDEINISGKIFYKTMFKLFLQCGYCAGVRQILKEKSQRQNYPLKYSPPYIEANELFGNTLEELQYLRKK